MTSTKTVTWLIHAILRMLGTFVLGDDGTKHVESFFPLLTR